MEAPQKKARKRKTKATSLSAEEISLIEIPQIKQLLIESLMLHKKEQREIQNSKNRDLEHFGAVAEEYLKCFVILGYDLHGDKVSIFNAHNDQEASALLEHVISSLSWLIPRVRGD